MSAAAVADLRFAAEQYVKHALADDCMLAPLYRAEVAIIVDSIGHVAAHTALMEMLCEVPIDGPDRTETPETLRRLELTASLMELYRGRK